MEREKFIKTAKYTTLGAAYLGLSYFGVNYFYEKLNNHFDQVAQSEKARLDREQLIRMSSYDDMNYSLPVRVEQPEDVWGQPEWVRPTNWERKVKK